MAHREQIQFVKIIKKHFPDFFREKRVVEIGSLDINGSVRQLFDSCDYIGVDIGEGPGVDVVASGHEFKGDSDSFDVAISCECLEHNLEWKGTIDNMIRMLKPGGALIMTFAGYGREEHGTSRTTPQHSPGTVRIGWEYYRNLGRKEIMSIRDILDYFPSLLTYENWSSCDFYAFGIKDEAGRSLTELSRELGRWLTAENRKPKSIMKRFVFMTLGETGVSVFRQVNRLIS